MDRLVARGGTHHKEPAPLRHANTITNRGIPWLPCHKKPR
jgi:hypothetical protein